MNVTTLSNLLASSAGLPVCSLISSYNLWGRLFSWQPQLFTVMLPSLDGAHITAMAPAFNSYPNMAAKLSKSQLRDAIASAGLSQFLNIFNAQSLASMPAENLAWAILEQPTLSLNQVTQTQWQNLYQAAPVMQSLLGAQSSYTSVIASELAANDLASQKTLLTLLGDPNLALYANPFLTPTQLCTFPLIGNALNDANTLIALYDQLYPGIQKNPKAYQALTNFYQQVLARESLITSPITPNSVVTNVNALFSFLTQARNVLIPAVPAATGTDVIAYTSNVASTFVNETGKFTVFLDSLSALSNQMKNLNLLKLDNVTNASFDPRVLLWLLNGAPTVGSGNISYNGVNNLTFRDAIQTSLLDLFNEADRFAVNCTKGINQVVANKTIADQKELIAKILDIIGVVASLGSGMGKTFVAFSSVASTLNDAIKQVSEVGSLVSSASSSVKNQTSDWLKPSVSAVTGKTQYNNILSSVSALTNAISAIGISDPVITQAQNQYLNDTSMLVATIATASKQGDEVLGSGSKSWSMSADQMSYGGNLASWAGVQGQVSFNYQDFYGGWHTGAFTPKYDGQTDVYNFTPAGFASAPVAGYTASQLVVSSDFNYLPLGGISAHATVTVHGYNPI